MKSIFFIFSILFFNQIVCTDKPSAEAKINLNDSELDIIRRRALDIERPTFTNFNRLVGVKKESSFKKIIKLILKKKKQS